MKDSKGSAPYMPAIALLTKKSAMSNRNFLAIRFFWASVSSGRIISPWAASRSDEATGARGIPPRQGPKMIPRVLDG